MAATRAILRGHAVRFTLTARDIDEAARAFGAEYAREHAALYRPRWNIAPTDNHWIVRLDGSARRMVPARFGIDGHRWAAPHQRPQRDGRELRTSWRALSEARCFVPADGFYEWQSGRAERRPLWFHDPAGKHLAFAGLAFEGAGTAAFVILTAAANDLMRPIHDRMPVLLSPEGLEAWLARADADLLVPAPDSWLAAREVSTLVNSVANDGPELLEAPAPARQLRFL